MGGEIYGLGAGRLIALLADYLSWETRNGRLAVAEPERAAEQFIGMLSGRVQLRALLGTHIQESGASLLGMRVTAQRDPGTEARMRMQQLELP